MNNLQETAVSKTLTTHWIGRRYEYYAAVGSTNDLLKSRIADGLAENSAAGTVVLTDFQSQGRGRLQRRWQAPPETSLLLSILFRPNWESDRMAWLTMLAGLAVVDAVRSVTGLAVALKWPNDVVWVRDGAWHKLCGLLLESNIGGDGRRETAVLGIGLNVNIPASQMPQGDTPPTSLLIATGKPVSRLLLLTELLQHLENRYEHASQGESPRAAWNKKLVTIGQQVQVRMVANQEALYGTAEDTDEFGRLLVRDGNGRFHPVSAGDVTLRSR